MFKEYNYNGKKKEITVLLRKRLTFRDKVRYCQKKVECYLDKIKTLEGELIPDVETKLDFYLSGPCQKTTAEAL